MKTGKCRCGNRIFFDNFECLACKAVLGRCNECKSLTSFSSRNQGSTCTCDTCHAEVHPCSNRAHQACNSFISGQESICQWCEFTQTVPDLNKPDNRRRWAVLEAAKRRLLLELDALDLPPFREDLRQTHPLRFQFLEDTVDADGQPLKTITGHDGGLITINLEEADSVHREKMRVELGEPQRTVIGHMRHEVGHYIDWSFASRVAPEEYQRLFGDPDAIDYGQAMERYYDQGAPNDWSSNYVSRYATMHPWEDFAETVNVYLDVMAIAATANDQGMSTLDLSPMTDARQLVSEVLEIVVAVSEFNSDLGLLPLLPERLPPAVIEKLSFVHGLRRKSLKPSTSRG